MWEVGSYPHSALKQATAEFILQLPCLFSVLSTTRDALTSEKPKNQEQCPVSQGQNELAEDLYPLDSSPLGQIDGLKSLITGAYMPA